jgi:di/tricarboxylate transporter
VGRALAAAAGVFKDPLLLVLIAVLAVLTAVSPRRIGSYPALVDWPTICALTGLLVLTKGLELSGLLHRVGLKLIGSMSTERAMALCLVLTAALLSTLLTNDVALFVVVPLTLGVCRMTGMAATRLIIFEALAVNAGSALTPIGNPQNIFLWHLSDVSFVGFIWHMLPLVALLMLLLVGLAACMFRSHNGLRADKGPLPALDRTMLSASLGLYLPFLIATDLHQAPWAALLVLCIFAVLRPKVLAQVDWALLLVFVLMFIDLRLLAGLDSVRRAVTALDLAQPLRLYFTAITASQLISNVPAAIALAEYSKDWRVLAYGVNVGGFGLALGSLANLIALRMAGDRRAWLGFHLYAVPFLFAAALLGYGLMRLGG